MCLSYSVHATYEGLRHTYQKEESWYGRLLSGLIWKESRVLLVLFQHNQYRYQENVFLNGIYYYLLISVGFACAKLWLFVSLRTIWITFNQSVGQKLILKLINYFQNLLEQQMYVSTGNFLLFWNFFFLCSNSIKMKTKSTKTSLKSRNNLGTLYIHK